MNRSENKIPISILVCDDDAGDRSATRQAISDARLANVVRYVDDAEQLLDFLYQQHAYAGENGSAPRPGLILLDLTIPTVNRGVPIRVNEVDETLRDIPVVFLSPSPLNGEAVRRFGLGGNTLMTKPVTLPGIMNALRSLERHWVEIVEFIPSG